MAAYTIDSTIDYSEIFDLVFSKRTRELSDGEASERTTKKSRTALEDQHAGKRDAKEKKRQKKKKKRHSVVTIEDGRAHAKDSRHSVPPFLDTTHVEGGALPVKASESSNTCSMSSTASPDNLMEEHDVEHIVSLTKGKGKGKATDLQLEAEIRPGPSRLETTEEQVARLIKELSFKNELIQQHQSVFNHIQQTITCQVCLELMHKPYALSPCGHLACHECLVSWFKASPPDDRVPPPPILSRKKTCPHCRAAVKDRPVQIWGVKSIVSNFLKSGLLQGTLLTPEESTQNGNNNADPWDGIFLKARHDNLAGPITRFGIEDDEDGVLRCHDCMHEIWNGTCSNCGRNYPVHNRPAGYEDFGWMSSEDEFDFGWGTHRILEVENERAMLAALRPPAPSRFHSETNSDDEVEDGYESSFIDDENHVDIPHGNPRLAPLAIDIASESEDEGPAHRPLSSNRRRTRSSRSNLIDLTDDDEELEVEQPVHSRGGPARRRRPPLVARSIVIVSDEDDQDVSGPRRGSREHASSSRRHHRNRNRIESTDEGSGSGEDSDGIDPGLAEQVAARERELYGDDGSVPRRLQQLSDDADLFSTNNDESDSDSRSDY